jgi:hypothetical protein
MRLFSSKAARLAAPIALTLLLGGSAYAFMASNAVSNSDAGVGTGTISGYTVGNIQYGLTGMNGDPDNLTTVTFTLTPATGNASDYATAVAVWFDNNQANVASSGNGDCSQQGGVASDGTTTWTCTLQGWSQDAGPAPSSTSLSVAAVH